MVVSSSVDWSNVFKDTASPGDDVESRGTLVEILLLLLLHREIVLLVSHHHGGVGSLAETGELFMVRLPRSCQRRSVPHLTQVDHACVLHRHR